MTTGESRPDVDASADTGDDEAVVWLRHRVGARFFDDQSSHLER